MENIENKAVEQNNETTIKEVQDKLKDILNLNEMENLIKSNEIEFDYKDTKYRVKKPTFSQKQEAYKKRVEKFTELIQDPKYILESDLKITYLKRNVDIDAMTREMLELIQKRDKLMVELGGVIKDKGTESELKQYKEEIEKLNNQIQILNIKKSSYLEFSLENQVMIYTYSYMTYLLSEKLVEDKWVKVWATYQDFENDKEGIVNKLSYYTTLIFGVEELQ